MARNSLVLTDADNTLWDTNAVFTDAQLLLLSHLEQLVGTQCPTSDRLGFVRSFDQALAERHHLHLRYPSQMLITAVAEGLRGYAPEKVTPLIIGGLNAATLSTDQIFEAASKYEAALRRLPSLLPGVREGLHLAQEHQVLLYVMTEGRIDLQRARVAAHGLQAVFSDVWELKKTSAQFERIRQRFVASEVFVIGDQADRDIIPAHQADCTTVLIPSRFQPRWSNVNLDKVASYIAPDYLNAMKWVTAQIDEPEQNSSRNV